MKPRGTEYTLGALADLLNLSLEGDPDVVVTGLATLSGAGGRDLSFYHHPGFFQALKQTAAGAVILRAADAGECPVNTLIADDPYVAYARASRLFATGRNTPAGIYASASVDPKALIGEDVSIQANVVIEAGATIGDGSVIGANCVIGGGSRLGRDCLLYPNVTLYSDVIIGDRAILHAGVVIGSDGFGFAFDGESHVKIEQLGGVRMGDDVEVGAGTCIDRGALENTVIGDGVKIDNQVQIAHNVRVGDRTVICGCSAVAGSSTIGKNCIIAGGVGIINHVEIADEVTVTAMSLVNQSIPQKGIYSSGTGLSETRQWKKNIVHFKQLDVMARTLKRLDKNDKRNKNDKNK